MNATGAAIVPAERELKPTKPLLPLVNRLPSPELGAAAAGLSVPQLKTEDFQLFRQLFLKCCGIAVGETKRLLVQNRVGKRLRALGYSSFATYYNYVMSAEGRTQELPNLLNAITTNETHFFRENHHFEILRRYILPELMQRASPTQPLRIWSAGCSTGQEPYTLAMVLDSWFSGKSFCHGFRVVGTDLDYDVLAVAESGRYVESSRKELPPPFLDRYMDDFGDKLVVKRELRNRVSFHRQNLAEVQPAKPRFEVIFCRNVIMYLHSTTRARLAEVFYDSLVDGGYVIVGSSESLREQPGLFEIRRFGRTLTYRRPLDGTFSRRVLPK